MTQSLNLLPTPDALDAFGDFLFRNEAGMTGLIMSMNGSLACVVAEEGTFAFDVELTHPMPLGWRVRFVREGGEFRLIPN